MKKYLLLLTGLLQASIMHAQVLSWTANVDSITTLSSPRNVDLGADGVMDIVIGTGKDGFANYYGVMAFSGLDGSLLWNVPSKDEIFTSPNFADFNNDGGADVVIGGRKAQLYAIDGITGNVIWEFFPYATNPADSGLYNFYSAQVLPDMNSDMIPDILVTNGGDHAAPVWQTNRPPGHLMVISGADGDVLAKAVVPDSAETYCSPVIADLRNDGILYIIFGTGGEYLGGSMWAAKLSDLMNNNISNAAQLATHPSKGFIAPASLAKFSSSGVYDIIIQSFSGTVYRIDGNTFAATWSTTIPNSESSASPAIGNFTGTITPDVFCVLNKGIAPSYTEHYQVMIDGATGNIEYKDSLGYLHFASANAFDNNGDGRDEALISVVNYSGNFTHQLMLIDFQNDTSSNYWIAENGTNLGSTPLISDVDSDGLIDITYAVRRDDTNPMGWDGMRLQKLNTSVPLPSVGIAWGSYMGAYFDGKYTYNTISCGSGSIISGSSNINPSCNGFADGTITPQTANGTAPFTFLWQDGSVGNSLSGIGAGTYSVMITDASGCTETGSFTINDPYVITFGGVLHNVCEGDSSGQATVNSSGCSCMFSGCTYMWSDSSTTTYTASGLPAGTHYVSITHNTGCVVTVSVNINDGAPLVTDSLISDVTCIGFNDGEIALTATYPATTIFNWTNGDTTNTADSLSPGMYTVYIKDNRPCFDTLTFGIANPDTLGMQFTMQNIPGCYGDSTGTINMTADGGTGALSYLLNGAVFTNGNFNSLGAGAYQIMVMDSLGCLSDSADVIITQPAQLALSLSSTPETDNGTSDGTATAIISGGTMPYSFLWNDILTQTTSTASGLSTGYYNVIVTDSNGCSVTDSVLVETTAFIGENGNLLFFSFFPNPVQEQINIRFSGISKNYSVKLVDMKGRVVQSYREIASPDFLILRGDLTSGQYLLEVNYNDQVRTMKLIIE